MAGTFACEVAAALSVALARRPALGIGFVVLAMLIARRWLRGYRRQVDLAIAAQIESAKILLADGRRTAAWTTAAAAARTAARGPLRNAALTLMAEIALADRDHETARELVAQMARVADPQLPVLEAKIECAAGQPASAIAALERARRRRSFGPAAARRLVELHAEADNLEQAVTVAIDHLTMLDGQDLRNMVASLEAWGAWEEAARLAGALAARSLDPAREVLLTRAPETEN
jgi:hypothetical protein